MKKFILGFIAGAILFGSATAVAATVLTAQIAEFDVLINGDKFETVTGEILVVDGHIYLPLRDMAEALDINIVWDDINRQVIVSAEMVYKNEIEQFNEYHSWLDVSAKNEDDFLIDKKYADILRPILIYYWGLVGMPTEQYVDDNCVLFDARFLYDIDSFVLDQYNDYYGPIMKEFKAKIDKVFDDYLAEVNS